MQSLYSPILCSQDGSRNSPSSDHSIDDLSFIHSHAPSSFGKSGNRKCARDACNNYINFADKPAYWPFCSQACQEGQAQATCGRTESSVMLSSEDMCPPTALAELLKHLGDVDRDE